MEHKEWEEEEKVPNEKVEVRKKEEEPEEDALKKSLFVFFVNVVLYLTCEQRCFLSSPHGWLLFCGHFSRFTIEQHVHKAKKPRSPRS
jgi:hypothetical protein